MATTSSSKLAIRKPLKKNTDFIQNLDMLCQQMMLLTLHKNLPFGISIVSETDNSKSSLPLSVVLPSFYVATNLQPSLSDSKKTACLIFIFDQTLWEILETQNPFFTQMIKNIENQDLFIEKSPTEIQTKYLSSTSPNKRNVLFFTKTNFPSSSTASKFAVNHNNNNNNNNNNNQPSLLSQSLSSSCLTTDSVFMKTILVSEQISSLQIIPLTQLIQIPINMVSVVFCWLFNYLNVFETPQSDFSSIHIKLMQAFTQQNQKLVSDSLNETNTIVAVYKPLFKKLASKIWPTNSFTFDLDPLVSSIHIHDLQLSLTRALSLATFSQTIILKSATKSNHCTILSPNLFPWTSNSNAHLSYSDFLYLQPSQIVHQIEIDPIRNLVFNQLFPSTPNIDLTPESLEPYILSQQTDLERTRIMFLLEIEAASDTTNREDDIVD